MLNNQLPTMGQVMVSQYCELIITSLEAMESRLQKINQNLGQYWERITVLNQDKQEDLYKFSQDILEMMKINQLLLLQLSKQALNIIYHQDKNLTDFFQQLRILEKCLEDLEQKLN